VPVLTTNMSADRIESESNKRNLKPTIKEERSTEIEKINNEFKKTFDPSSYMMKQVSFNSDPVSLLLLVCCCCCFFNFKRRRRQSQEL
jgi:hypothetical protein